MQNLVADRFEYPGHRRADGLVMSSEAAPNAIARPGPDLVNLVAQPPAGYQVIGAYIVPRTAGRPMAFEMQRYVQLAKAIDLVFAQPAGSPYLPEGFATIGMATPKLIAGGSFGGLTSQAAVLRHPELFHGAGNGAFSGSVRRTMGEQFAWNLVGRRSGMGLDEVSALHPRHARVGLLGPAGRLGLLQRLLDPAPASRPAVPPDREPDRRRGHGHLRRRLDPAAPRGARLRRLRHRGRERHTGAWQCRAPLDARRSALPRRGRRVHQSADRGAEQLPSDLERAFVPFVHQHWLATQSVTVQAPAVVADDGSEDPYDALLARGIPASPPPSSLLQSSTPRSVRAVGPSDTGSASVPTSR